MSTSHCQLQHALVPPPLARLPARCCHRAGKRTAPGRFGSLRRVTCTLLRLLDNAPERPECPHLGPRVCHRPQAGLLGPARWPGPPSAPAGRCPQARCLGLGKRLGLGPTFVLGHAAGWWAAERTPSGRMKPPRCAILGSLRSYCWAVKSLLGLNCSWARACAPACSPVPRGALLGQLGAWPSDLFRPRCERSITGRGPTWANCSPHRVQCRVRFATARSRHCS